MNYEIEKKIKIGFFNINGLIGETTFNPDFSDIIKKYEIIVLTETWHDKVECINKIKGNFPDDYKFIENARKNKNKKSKRNSGGILVCYKKTLHNDIKIVDKNTENMIWLKLKKEKLNASKDLIIGGIYNSPINSSYSKKNTNDIFEIIQEKIMYYSQNNHVMIGGDFNARTGNIQDIIIEDENDIETLSLPPNYEISTYKRYRNNQDQHTNAYGTKLIELATNTNMKILNGRVLGDLLGKYTYIGYNGISTVDYVLCTENFLTSNYIQSFQVDELTLLSDHRLIHVTLKSDLHKKETLTKEKAIPKTTKRNKNFNLKNHDAFATELNTLMNNDIVNLLINKLETINIAEDQTNTLENIIQEISNIYTLSAKKLCHGGRDRNKLSRKPSKAKNTWYTQDCKALKRKLNQIRKLLDQNPNKIETRHLFYKTQKEYKRLVKHKRKKNEENLIDKLECLYSQDRTEFWKYLKALNNTQKREEPPQLDKLITHFKKLYFDDHCDNNLVGTDEPLDTTNKRIFENLNNQITEKEVNSCIQGMKNRKSPGNDLITNEMIKCTNENGIKLLTKLFNTILNKGYFPKEWNYGLLRLLFKGGEAEDENNYRAITLNSCLGKIFCTVLHNRLGPILEEKNILCREQAGFRKNHRTTDHIFLLKKIVKTFISQNKYLFTCFVDFSKAFDSIWREALINKISKIGIHGKFLNIIKSIYNGTTNSIIHGNTLSEVFQSNKGVKQGDTLSTTLFNLFINDLPNIFTFDGNNPITIGDVNISCLSYADDLIIMSSCPISLQKCIKKLEEYCTKWKLEVNLKKTKIVIFNKQGTLIKKHKFHYKQNLIQNTKEYKYLGFTFSCSGSDSLGTQTLLNQAKKAWYAIKSNLTKSLNKNVKTYLHLFDTQVKPIMLYSCETWIDFLKNDNNIIHKLRKCKLENVQIGILKQILGVRKNTSNIAMLLETGRHPLALHALERAIKYFLRLPSTGKNSLLYKYYEKEKKNIPLSDNFLKYITDNLDKIGMTNIWRQQLIHEKDMSKDIKRIMEDIKNRLKDISSQTIINTLATNPGKLTHLQQMKESHVLETYLYINNFEHRRAITKIRTSSHTLQIETGRWNNISQNLRICENCVLDEVEDENHFLFLCPMHIVERQKFYNTVEAKLNVDLSRIFSHEDKLKEIFHSEDLAILNAFGKYIKNSFKKRESTICHVLAPHYIYYADII